YREHVVEGPGVAHAGHRSVGRVDELALDGHPDVRMRLRRCGRDDETRKRRRSAKKETTNHRFARHGSPACSPNFSCAQAHDITDCGGMEARNAIAPTWQSNAKSTPPRRRRLGCLRMFHPDAAPPPRHGP